MKNPSLESFYWSMVWRRGGGGVPGKNWIGSCSEAEFTAYNFVELGIVVRVLRLEVSVWIF